MRIAVNYPPLLIVENFVDSCLQYFLSDFERNCRSLIWKMIICRLKSTIVEFSKITKVLIVETKLIVDRLLRKRKFVDTSLQIFDQFVYIWVQYPQNFRLRRSKIPIESENISIFAPAAGLLRRRRKLSGFRTLPRGFSLQN